MSDLNIGTRVQIDWPGWSGEGEIVLIVPRVKSSSYNVKMLTGAKAGSIGGFEVITRPGEYGIKPVPTAPPNRTYAKGDQVRITYPGWEGTGVVQNKWLDGSYSVKMLTGSMKNTYGAFDPKHLLPGYAPITIETTKVKSIPAQPAVKSQARVIARQLAITLGKQERFITSDRVQEELKKLNFTSNDLGNAAGSLFSGGLFKRTDKTVRSNRPEANRRRIFVWEYVGATGETIPAPKKYVVEYRSFGDSWSRSGNIQRSKNSGIYLHSITFNTKTEAEAEAKAQEEYYQGRNVKDMSYRVVPVN